MPFPVGTWRSLVGFKGRARREATARLYISRFAERAWSEATPDATRQAGVLGSRRPDAQKRRRDVV